MKQGYEYYERERKRKRPKVPFDFLEDEFIVTNKGERSLYHYLHGSCDIFAYYLALCFNYPLVIMRKKNGAIIHCFCKKDDYFIDVRGITKDYEEFIAEYPHVYYNPDRYITIYPTFDDYNKMMKIGERLKTDGKMLDSLPDFYKIEEKK